MASTDTPNLNGSTGSVAPTVPPIVTYANNVLNQLPNAPVSDPNFLGSNLVFPSDLESYRFHIAFQFKQFQRRSLDQRTFDLPQGGIFLPVPTNLVDTQSIVYDTSRNTPMIGALLDAGAKATSGQGFAAAMTAASKGALAAGGLQTTKGVLNGAASLLGGSQSTADQVMSLVGLATNPFLTILFQSPTFKQHQFQWRLAANTPEESLVLQKIINKIRYHMLPDRVGGLGGTLLAYPDMCTVGLFPSDTYLYKFKPCVVTQMSANFAPNTPAFYGDTSAPAEVMLTITLLEIEYWLKEDVALANPGLIASTTPPPTGTTSGTSATPGPVNHSISIRSINDPNWHT